MITTRENFLVDRKEISYLRWIIESYDGMAFIKTIDSHKALIELEIPSGCEGLIYGLLDYLRENEQLRIDPIRSDQDLYDLDEIYNN